MSDVEIGAAEVVVTADTTAAEANVKSLMSRITTFGNAASGGIGNVIGKVNLLGQAMGPGSPVAGMAGPLTAISTGFETINTRIQTATASGSRFAALRGAFEGVGLVLLAAGAAATAFSAPLQNANAALETSIRNTGDGSQGMEDYADSISKADEQGKKFGFTNADVNQALSQLTAETRNPTEALKELTMTETLAAATHSSLGSAARQMGQIHAGMYRSLRQFGIQLPQIRNDTNKLAGEEIKLAEAGTKVTQAHEKVAAYQAELNQKMQEDQAKYSQAVADDQSRLGIAQENLAELQQKVSVEDKQQRENLAATVEETANRQMAAEQNLADLRERLRKGGSQDVENAMSQADAEARLNDARVRVATTSGAQQQAAIEQLRSAKEAATRENLRQKDQQVSDAHAIRDATNQVASSTEAHNKALQQQADFSIVAQQHQIDLEKATLAVSTANQKLVKDQQALVASQQPTIAQAEKLKTLQDIEAKAAQDRAGIEQKIADIKDQQARLDAGFAEAERQFMDREGGLLDRREHTWAGHVAKIKAHILDLLQESGKLAPALFMIGGASSAIGALSGIPGGIKRGVKGVGGILGKLGGSGGGTVEGAFEGATVGRDPLTGRFTKLGEEAAGGESVIGESVSKILGHIKNLGKGEDGVVSFANAFGKISTGIGGIGGKIGSFVGTMVTAGGSIAAAGWTAIAPWLPLIAAIGGLILVGYLVYRNWDTIKALLADIWNGMLSVGKTVFNGISDVIGTMVDFVTEHWKLLLAIFVPGAQIFIVLDFFKDHWSSIWDIIKKMPAEAWNFIVDILKAMVKGYTSTIEAILNVGSHLPDFLGGGIFKSAKKDMEGLSSTILDGLDALKIDTSDKAKAVGQTLGNGISWGISHTDTRRPSAQVVDAFGTAIKSAAEISSPSKLFARTIGVPLSQGIGQGMLDNIVNLNETGRKMIAGIDFGKYTPYNPGLPSTNAGGSNSPVNPTPGPGGTGKVIHFEPHFHQEISPLQVAHELAWDARV